MLKRNKAVSIVMALCLCLAMLAPVFVAPKSAEASTTYEVVSANTVTANASTDKVGVIKVTLPDTSLFNYDCVTVSLPSDVDFNGEKAVISGTPGKTTDTGYGVVIYAPGDGSNDYMAANDFADSDKTAMSDGKTYNITNDEFTIYLKPTTTGADKYFYIYFNDAKVNTTGDLDVSFDAPSNSAFSSSDSLTIGKATSEGSTTTSIKKVNNITEAGGTIQPITVVENSAGTLNFYDKVTLEILTDGYSWGDQGAIKDSTNTIITPAASTDYGWSLTGTGTAPAVDSSNDQKITTTLSEPTSGKMSTDGINTKSPAKITFNNLKIAVDDTKANVGDEVQVKVSGANIDKTTVVVAKYCDYSATVEAGTTETLIAGQKDQDIGDFYIEEGAAESLTSGRSVTLTLPSGVEWETGTYDTSSKDYSYSDSDNYGTTTVVNSSNFKWADTPCKITGDNNQIAKWTIGDGSKDQTNGAKIKFKDMKVCVSPAFSGTLTITVGGSAGVTGTVDVGTVVPAVTMTAGDVANVVLGEAGQKINDVTITEGSDGAIMEDTDNEDLILKLDAGYTWSTIPTVKVTSGDLDLDTDNITTDDQELIIPVNSASNTASTITISDISITADRTAPEGAVCLAIAKQNSSQSSFKSNPTNEVSEYWDKSSGKVTIANCVTAAETTGSNVFTIGSNVFECNGTKMVMDVAPYIKSSRTYVPMRYLAEMVGADVAWDATAQTVTLTKGSTVVVFTIGSNAYTINGAAQTADVAPEIVNSRTFLPARFVAEAFGYQAGWDASTNTVVISE